MQQFAAANDCVMAQQLTIKFDNGKTQASTPLCVKTSEEPTGISAQVVPLGTKTFTSGSPSFVGVDNNGMLSAQYTNSAGLPVAFGYNVDRGVQAIATTYPVVRFDRTPGNCSYTKSGVPISYWYHWSCRGHSYQTQYRLNGNLVFRVLINGRTGTADLEVAFNYKIVSI